MILEVEPSEPEERIEPRVRLADRGHDPHLAAVFQKQGRSGSRRPWARIGRTVKPNPSLAEIVLPPLMRLISCGRDKVLLTKARPVDQVPFVNLERSIEAGIEDRRQRYYALGKGRSFAEKGQA